jgi:predicted nucleic acid-binding protein
MSQVVVDTDVASYIFNWHSSARRYVDALRGSESILSFMSIAEIRMGAIARGWGVRRRTLLEQFIRGFGVVYADDAATLSIFRSFGCSRRDRHNAYRNFQDSSNRPA